METTKLDLGAYGPARLSFFRWTAALIFICVLAISCLSQQKAIEKTPPRPATILAAPRSEVPDVRGQNAADARANINKAGLTLGRTSEAAGPGVAGTVETEDPPQHTGVMRGSTVNIVLVAPKIPVNTGTGGEESNVQVPPLNGMNPNQASVILQGRRLALGNITPGNGKGDEGTIYSQDPGATRWVRPGTKINVETVEPAKSSVGPKGPVWVLAPNLVGQTEKGAAEILEDMGLGLGSVTSGSSSDPAGTIFGQDPPAKTRVLSGTTVNVRVATAPPQPRMVSVPAVTQLTLMEAINKLKQSGLQIGSVTYEVNDGTTNSIFRQSPEANALAEPGSAVSVVIAQARPAAPIPDVVKHDVQQAVAILDAAGFQLGTVSEQESDTTSGTILFQNPPAGSLAQPGATVDVTVSKQNTAQLIVLMSNPNPQIGNSIKFRAELEPAKKGARFQFTFGDGNNSGWLTSAVAMHSYGNSGTFQVQAVAVEGGSTISSETVTVTIPAGSNFVPVTAAAVGGGIMVVGWASFVYHGRKLFRRWVRVESKIDTGTQRVTDEGNAGGAAALRFRVVQNSGNSTVVLPSGPKPGKAETR